MAVICANTFFSDCYRHILSIADNLHGKKLIKFDDLKTSFCAIYLS